MLQQYPVSPWHLTLAVGWLQNLSSFFSSKSYARNPAQLQSSSGDSVFLRAQPWPNNFGLFLVLTFNLMTTEHKLYMYPSFFAPNIWNPFNIKQFTSTFCTVNIYIRHDLRWPQPIYMRVSYDCLWVAFFSRNDLTDFYDFCILNKEWSYFEKMLLLFSWYKNVWDIGIYLMNMYNQIFIKNVNNFEMPQQLQQINLRAL